MVKKNKKYLNVKNWQLIVGGIIILLVLDIGIQAIKARQDVNTRETATVAGEKVEAYIDQYRTIPSDLATINYTVPKTVRYEKINDKTFQFCELFHRNNNPSVSKLSMFANLVINRPSDYIQQNHADGKFGTMVVDDLHNAGIECQTVYYYSLQQ